MTIGSKTVASSAVSGSYGEIEAERGVVTLEQDVQFQEIEPERQLIAFDQDVWEVEPARQLVRFRQSVLQAGATEVVPVAYVTVGGVDYTATTALDTVVVSHTEDQSSTASVFLFFADDAVINIPSFHGKTLEISTHSDPSDINSEIIPLFTGWVETAKYDRDRRGIAINGSDLRDERLGREDQQQLQALTGGLYSNVTQREEAEGREYVTELMKTVSGSIGYNRDGSLLFHNWGTASGIDAVYGDADVAYDGVEVEFQTRSSIINSVDINIQYQYQRLRTLTTNVDAYKRRMFPVGIGFDGRAFDRNDMLQKLESFSPWELIRYTFYPLERFKSYFVGANRIYVTDAAWTEYGRTRYCQGIDATLKRRIAQPVRENYSMTIDAPQSIDAYSETVKGTELNFSLSVDYDRSNWEQDYKEGTQVSVTESFSYQQALADNRRDDLANAFDCAYAIAKKEIISSHRKNYVSFDRLQTIDQYDVGDVIQINTRIIQTTGQIVSLEYTFADGVRNTSYKIAVSYMDTEVAAPIEDYSRPDAPAKPGIGGLVGSSAVYNTNDGAFDIIIRDIQERYTDELEQDIDNEYSLPIENTSITLINGY